MVEQWDRIWSYSSFYVERLKTVEITLTGLEEVTIVVNEFEMKLASYDSMPSDMENLRKAHDELMTLEAEIQDKQVSSNLETQLFRNLFKKFFFFLDALMLMMIIDFLFCPRQHALFTIYILLQINNILSDLCLKKSLKFW